MTGKIVYLFRGYVITSCFLRFSITGTKDIIWLWRGIKERLLSCRVSERFLTVGRVRRKIVHL